MPLPGSASSGGNTVFTLLFVIGLCDFPSSCLYMMLILPQLRGCIHIVLSTSWPISLQGSSSDHQDRNLGHYHSARNSRERDHGADPNGILSDAKRHRLYRRIGVEIG